MESDCKHNGVNAIKCKTPNEIFGFAIKILEVKLNMKTFQSRASLVAFNLNLERIDIL